MLDPLKMAELLRRRVAGEPFPYNFIRKEDPYSAAPEDLVREHAPGTDPGQGKGVAWFCWPAECHESAGGGSASKRKRKVAAAGATYWHPEARRKPILGTDKKPVGAYKRALSYVKDVKNPPGMATPFRRKRLGWCMLEIGLHGADKQLVLCKLYKSPRPPTDPETSTEAGVPGGGMPSPAPAPAPLTAEIPISRVAIVRNDGPAPSNPAARSIHSPRLASRSTMKWGPLPTVAVEARHGGKKPAMWPTVVMKFGRSSLASAEEMKQVAKLFCCFNEETPVVVLSAMGETTDKLLQAGHQAMRCDAQDVCKILDLDHVKNSHLSTVHELGLQSSTISGTLDWLERHLKRIARTQDLSAKKLDYLLSFGERLSTNILSAYLNELGTKAVQYNELDLGLVTTDKYTDIMQATYSAIAEQLEGDWIDEPAMPIIAGFLGKEWESCALTTSGRGVSDLTAITIGRALESREIQIWKDVDGLLTCDPNICSNAIPIPILTFHEAAELAYFGAQVLHSGTRRSAREVSIPVRVKNLYNPHNLSTLTGIVIESNITVLDIESTRKLGHNGFLANVLSILDGSGISVDYMATDKGKISLALDPSKLPSSELIQLVHDNVVEELQQTAVVHVLEHRSVVSLVGNTQMLSSILGIASNVLLRTGVKVQMISQGLSNSEVMKVSLVVHDSDAKDCVKGPPFGVL